MLKGRVEMGACLVAFMIGSAQSFARCAMRAPHGGVPPSRTSPICAPHGVIAPFPVMRADADDTVRLDDGIARVEQEIIRVQGEVEKVEAEANEVMAELAAIGMSKVSVIEHPAVVRLRDEKKQLRDEKNLLLEKLGRLESGVIAKAVRAWRAPGPTHPPSHSTARAPHNGSRGLQHCLAILAPHPRVRHSRRASSRAWHSQRSSARVATCAEP